ncbi:SDR family NAD(P)-dependent oxidoreductase [Rhodococcus pseudokoreensis]|uniref:SDR family NAD(P)-dependent oxidoreductase n=1 Tax=Rhodococcus pseudokoreensis TaxID=2811421 RepID=A0A974W835_9NOCA|nr:SDR family NAD(P)-dependent oxidoreductase [Rhodococcus pseudokoreensis]QSE93013.1 SDR family NAD(P)-dependent oxidoreductase [Rhodococcus pseudokoreensis]
MIEAPVVIVTGGAGYIGRGLCELFLKDGYVVVVADLNAEAAERTASEIGGSDGHAIGVGIDVTDETSAADMVHAVESRFGRIDALINNAGLFGDPTWTGPMLGVDMKAWDAVMEVNVKGPVVVTRAVAPIMRKAKWGRIVNVSSQGAYKPAGVYSASKLAVHQVTWNLAKELGDDGITVNCVAPGTMDTPTAFANKPRAHVLSMPEKSIVKRLGNAADLYAAMKYFVSKESEWCTGQSLLVNGGAEVRL